jgi:hypothetical protein
VGLGIGPQGSKENQLMAACGEIGHEEIGEMVAFVGT